MLAGHVIADHDVLAGHDVIADHDVLADQGVIAGHDVDAVKFLRMRNVYSSNGEFADLESSDIADIVGLSIFGCGWVFGPFLRVLNSGSPLWSPGDIQDHHE